MLIVVLAVALAQAAPATDPYRVRWAADAAITGAALLATPLTRAIPGPAPAPWQRQLLPVDDAVEANFSARAAVLSDGLLATTMLVPLVAQAGYGLDESTGAGALVYVESIAITELLTNGVKRLVRRPRPYTYSSDPRVRAYAAAEGDDAYLSFFSGHAASTFVAAVAGSYLFALRSSDEKARAALWGLELALATGTAGLRVRAGKHFYSDVIVGALVGAGVGFATVRLHERRGGSYTPGAIEWAAMGSGVLVGALASGLAPFGRDLLEPLGADTRAALVPLVVQGGGGMAVAVAL